MPQAKRAVLKHDVFSWAPLRLHGTFSACSHVCLPIRSEIQTICALPDLNCGASEAVLGSTCAGLKVDDHCPPTQLENNIENDRFEGYLGILSTSCGKVTPVLEAAHFNDNTEWQKLHVQTAKLD